MLKKYCLFLFCFSLLASEARARNTPAPVVEREVKAVSKVSLELETGAGIISGSADGGAFTANASLRHQIKKLRQTLSFSSLLTTDTAPNGKQARQVGGSYRLRYFWFPVFSSFVGGAISNQPLYGQNLSANGQGGMALHLFLKQKRSARFEAGYSRNHAEETPGGASNSNSFFTDMTWEEPLAEKFSFAEALSYSTNLANLEGYSFGTESAINYQFKKSLKLSLNFSGFFNNQPVTGFQQWDFLALGTMGISF